MKKFLSLIAIIAISTTTEVYAHNFTLKSNDLSGTNSVVTSPSKKSYSNGFAQGFSEYYDSQTPSSLGRLATTSTSGVSRDPYFVQIDGTKYMLIKENSDKKFDKNDILGIKDTKETVFASLRPLDINRDNKLTGEELTKSGVRLVKIGQNGKLINDKNQDFQNSKIVYIYMKELRKSYKNDGNTGDFGMYDVLVKNNDDKTKLVTGFVSFETEEELSQYF